jgi:hypothetical protein
VVSVLAIGPKVRDFRPGRRILRAIKIRSMTSFRGGVQPSVQCRKICGMLKNVTSRKRYFVVKVQAISRHVPLLRY